LRFTKEKKAISTLLAILLILCFMIIGGLISYMWTLSSFYYEPQGTELAITEVNFPIEHADYFNLTIMNPSHSPSATNITQIYLEVEGSAGLINITDTSPDSLPIMIEKATSKTIKCLENWSGLVGKTVTVHVSTTNATGVSQKVQLPFAKLDLDTDLDPAVSSKRFNVTVKNDPNSAINLTVTRILLSRNDPDVLTPALPVNLTMGEAVQFLFTYDLENILTPIIRAETSQGYYAELTANSSARLLLRIADVVFDETNSQEMNITLTNPATATNVSISSIKILHANETGFINGSLTTPPFDTPYQLNTSSSVTFAHCIWNWQNVRNEIITIEVYTAQEFAAVSRTVRTPPSVILKIKALDFNLTNTGYFMVNVTNMAGSAQDTNITQIKLNDNVTDLTPQVVPIGEDRQLNCTFDWSSLRGTTANITIYDPNGLLASENITLPSVDLRIPDVTFGNSTEGIPYANVTVMNTIFSTQNVTITMITFNVEGKTIWADGTLTNPQLAPNGTMLMIGANVTIICPFAWASYPSQTLTVTVFTAEGFGITETFPIPQLNP
jgi:hypothetical protein